MSRVSIARSVEVLSSNIADHRASKKLTFCKLTRAQTGLPSSVAAMIHGTNVCCSASALT